MESSTNDIELLTNINKVLNENPEANQRDLAKSVNLSLGMTNSLIKRFAEKGWLCMKKLSARNMQYFLTPEGVNELAKRSYHYLQRTMKTVSLYKDIIVNTIAQAQKEGFKEVKMIGTSDISFLVEYACGTIHMPFAIVEENQILKDKSIICKNALFIIGSNEEKKLFESMENTNYLFIDDLLMRNQL